MKTLCVARFDSGFKWGASLARRFAARGASIDFLRLDDTLRSTSHSDAQAIVGDRKLFSASPQAFAASPAPGDYDAIFLLVDGRSSQEFILTLRQALASRGGPRPIVACAYAGLVLENELGGLAGRSGGDLLFANCVHDAALFRSACAPLGFDPARIITVGLPYFPADMAQRVRRIDDKPPSRVLFAAQPSLPGHVGDRRLLLSFLLDYAQRHPARQVTLRPRHRPAGNTFNPELHPFETLLETVARNRELPGNFELTYTPITELFETHDHCLTLSSTSAVEALSHDIAFNTLIDFGFNAPVWGARFFLPSGRAITMDDFLNDRLGRLREDWIADHLALPGDPADTILDALEDLARDAPGRLVTASSLSSKYIEADLARRARLAQTTGKKPARRQVTLADYESLAGLPRSKVKRSFILASANLFARAAHWPLVGPVFRLVRVAALLDWISNDRQS